MGIASSLLLKKTFKEGEKTQNEINQSENITSALAQISELEVL